MTDSSNQSDGETAGFRSGVYDILPALPPNIPFGMLFGAAAADVGITPVEATAMSLFVFAGAAQLAAVDLLQTDTALPIILFTVLVINIRYVIYSASIAPLVQDLPRRWRAVMGFGLFDVNFAFFMDKFNPGEAGSDEAEDSNIHKGRYYLGLTIPAVGSFVVATALGGFVGNAVGEELNLSFAIPLIFIAILAPLVDTRPAIVTVIVAAVVSIGAAGLPFNVGLLVAIFCAVCVGTIIENLDRISGGVTR
ncbi:AzlC family ABC transporter permease [Halovenus marina]|uniref:AzlC family ABC transporter permease n=1 Tax=Halovenus marina TaxID=3396621 RepID=UPI003F564920